MDFFPTIKLQGKPFEMGFTHGRYLSNQIKENVSFYLKLIQNFSGMQRERVFEIAKKFLTILKEETPQLVEEMEGIAQAAEVSLESIMILNARTELMSANGYTRECTSVGLSGARTTNNQTLLAQNWDWLPFIKTRSALFRLEPKNGYRLLLLCEAGQIAKIGINEKGLGVLLNLLFVSNIAIGIPVHILLRLILNEPDTKHAVDLVKKTRRASASHFLLGDTTGEIVGLEFTPNDMAKIYPDYNTIIHTNHFYRLDVPENEVTHSVLPCSLARIQRAKELIAQREKWGYNDLKSLLKDHENKPSSICRHIDNNKPKHMRVETIASLILDLSGKTMQVSYGQPCENTYKKVKLLD